MANSAASIAIKLQKLSNEATTKSFKFNKEEAATARTWQKMMSDTAHQREVADLKKAGLNPVLATNSGAQAYTTSSASGQAENAANAVGNIYGAEMSANATRSAAATSAAAMKAAAAQQAAAARYAASLQFEASKYAADRRFDESVYGWNKKEKIQKGINENQLKILDKTPPKNTSELVWKLADQSGVREGLITGRVVKSVTSMVKTLANDPMKYFKQVKTNAINDKNFILNSHGYKQVSTALKSFGVKPSVQASRYFIKAFVFGDVKSMKKLANMMPRKTKVNSARKIVSTHASGSGGRMVMSPGYSYP